MGKIVQLLAVHLLFTACVFAQSTVKGNVTDSKDGSPLSAISVNVQGEKKGTVTNADGFFVIDIGKATAILEFTGVGYLHKSVKVSAGETLTVALEQDAKTLGDVVVTGVGAATNKKNLAIDVGTLSTKNVAKSVLGSVEQALQGKIAGAQIQFLTGTPASRPIIILRTLNTLSYSPPLIMIDGVQVTSLEGLDLAAIERMEVVKGAAGGMLYGANGANGVIQLFTKKGVRNRKLQVDVLSQVSVGKVIKGNDIFATHHSYQTDAEGFITQGGARIRPSSIGQWPTPDYISPGSLTGYFAMQNKPYKEQTYDHLDQVYKTAYTFNNSVTMSGGGDKTDYSLTLSNYDEQNVVKNSYSRKSIGANLGFELWPGLTFRTITQVQFIDEDLLSGNFLSPIGTLSNRFGMTMAYSFTDFEAKDSTGHYVIFPRNDPFNYNPLSEAEWHQRKSNTTRIIENANLHYKFPKFLEIDYKYGIDIISGNNHDHYYNQAAALQSSVAFWGPTSNGSIRETYNKRVLQNSVLTAIVKTDFEKDFKLNVPIKTTTLYAYDYRNDDYNTHFAQGTGLPAYPPYNTAVAATQTSGITDINNNYPYHFVTFGSLFTQSFEYKDLIGISGGFRSDYSSTYGAGHTPFTFPRGAIYFRPSALIKMETIADWKLRATYAEAGIQPPVYSNQNTLLASNLGNTPILSYSSNAANPGLQVQLSKELEIGTDVLLKTKFHNWFQQISFSFNYWNRKGREVLANEELALSYGFSSRIDNLVDLDAKGFDLSLDAEVLSSRNVTWQFSYRIGSGKTKVTRIANGADIVQSVFTVKQGEELGLLNLPAPLTSADQLRPDGTRYIANTNAGNYELVNGMLVDTVTKAVQFTDVTDKKNAGSTVPKFTSSFINSFTIKKYLVISIQIDWVYGNKIYNMTNQWLYRDRRSADFDKPVTINGVTGPFVAYYASMTNHDNFSTYFVEDGSYARLRDISISYNLASIIKRKWLRDLSVTFSGRNLITVTNYSGLDPEATTTANLFGNEARPGFNGALYGVDWFAVPNLKSYQCSVKIGF